MYDGIEAVSIAVAAAEAVAMGDRQSYIPYFEAAERFIHTRNLIVGGNTGILFLLGQNLGPEDFTYEIYSNNAYQDAKEFTDEMFKVDPSGLGEYTNMRTEIYHAEFTVNINERLLFRFTALEVHRGARAVDIIMPTPCPAYYAKNARGEPLPIHCLGPEIQLMRMYSELSDPSAAGRWAGLLAQEEALRVRMKREVRNKIQQSVRRGGSEPGPTTHDVLSLLLTEFVPLSGHVLIGSFARAALGTGEKEGGRTRIQVVSANPLGTERDTIIKLTSRLGVNIQGSVNDPKLPTDQRLRKLTMYIIRPGSSREPVIDVFNSGEYELIPSVRVPLTRSDAKGTRSDAKGTRSDAEGTRSDAEGTRSDAKGNRKRSKPSEPILRVGTPFVLMRFSLVDMWTIQLLFRMKEVGASYAKQLLLRMFDEYADTERALRAKLKDERSFPEIFPPTVDDYVGQHTDPVVVKKRAQFAMYSQTGRDRKRMFRPPYYPARQI